MTIDKTIISDLVGALTDPIVVFPGGWGDTLPAWLTNQIVLERLTMNMETAPGQQPTGTDAEACAYLYTACLAQPMHGDWVRIYLYVSTKTCVRAMGEDVPEDIKVESLTSYQASKLEHLKRWIYQKRVEARKERDRIERKQKKQKDATEMKAMQPEMFEF